MSTRRWSWFASPTASSSGRRDDRRDSAHDARLSSVDGNDNLSGIAVSHRKSVGDWPTHRRYTYALLVIPARSARSPGSRCIARRSRGCATVGAPGSVMRRRCHYKRSRRGRPKSIGPPTSCFETGLPVIVPSRFLRTGTTSGSSAHRASTSRSAVVAFAARRVSGVPHETTTPLVHRPRPLTDSADAVDAILDVLETNRTRSISPPKASRTRRRGLFTTLGGGIDAKSLEMVRCGS